MPRAEATLLDEPVQDSIASLIRVRAGRVPGTTVLDLHSRDGFVAERFADTTDWTVHAPEELGSTEGVETHDIDPPSLPFEDDSLAAIVGAYVEERADEWTAELLDEMARVLVPEGRLVVAFQAPGPYTENVERALPHNVTQALGRAGFDEVTETTEQHLPDGSDLRLLRAALPEG